MQKFSLFFPLPKVNENMVLQVLPLFIKDRYSSSLERTFHILGFFGWLLKASCVLSFQDAARGFLSLFLPPRVRLSLL